MATNKKENKFYGNLCMQCIRSNNSSLYTKMPGISPGLFKFAKMIFLYFGFSGHMFFLNFSYTNIVTGFSKNAFTVCRKAAPTAPSTLL